jgi:hypothetical protein
MFWNLIISVLAFIPSSRVADGDCCAAACAMGLPPEVAASAGLSPAAVRGVLASMESHLPALTALAQDREHASELTAQVRNLREILTVDPTDADAAQDLTTAELNLMSVRAEARDREQSICDSMLALLEPAQAQMAERRTDWAGADLPAYYLAAFQTQEDARNVELARICETRCARRTEPLPNNVATILSTARGDGRHVIARSSYELQIDAVSAVYFHGE